MCNSKFYPSHKSHTKGLLSFNASYKKFFWSILFYKVSDKLLQMNNQLAEFDKIILQVNIRIYLKEFNHS